MKYGIDVVTLGDYANPRLVVRLAQAAEAAGWEGLFIWDHLAFAWGEPSGDPRVILAAVAQATTRLKIGTASTPVTQRRPQVLANTLATLDLLSEGRVILGAGTGGVPREFSAFGESEDARQRARQLDESLDILNRLWAGEKVVHHGPCYAVDGVTLVPLPLRRPHVPIRVGGASRPALRRAARWDGWVIGGDNQEGQMITSPRQAAEQLAYIRAHPSTSLPFNVALTGCSKPANGVLTRDFAVVGVTWWLESLHGFRGSFDKIYERVVAGPPI
jgi:alkanesulfonate monooxygenase SsuD/methylene tetrahydromethanopterin reductase-like flavin-dependent oxidoreductase (luciferase family)